MVKAPTFMLSLLIYIHFFQAHNFWHIHHLNFHHWLHMYYCSQYHLLFLRRLLLILDFFFHHCFLLCLPLQYQLIFCVWFCHNFYIRLFKYCVHAWIHSTSASEFTYTEVDTDMDSRPCPVFINILMC